LKESSGIPIRSKSRFKMLAGVGGQHLMTRPLSTDLRQRVVAAVLAGESCRSVAARFGVAVSSAVKWSQRYRATGSVAPGRMGGHRKRVLEPHCGFIIDRLRAMPHLTLHGLKDELAARGVSVSHNAVWLFLRREGLRFKACPREGGEKRCWLLRWPAPTLRGGGSVGEPWQPLLDPARLVFIDETPHVRRSGRRFAARTCGFLKASAFGRKTGRPLFLNALGSRPIWRRCGAGDRKAGACEGLPRMATGAP
jgi:transposase